MTEGSAGQRLGFKPDRKWQMLTSRDLYRKGGPWTCSSPAPISHEQLVETYEKCLWMQTPFVWAPYISHITHWLISHHLFSNNLLRFGPTSSYIFLPSWVAAASSYALPQVSQPTRVISLWTGLALLDTWAIRVAWNFRSLMGQKKLRICSSSGFFLSLVWEQHSSSFLHLKWQERFKVHCFIFKMSHDSSV